MDKTLNEFHRKGRIKWVTKPTPFVTPMFIVWRTINGIKKSRIIANLHALNKTAIPDIYSLPLPESIIAFLISKRFITVVDIKLSFYQYGIYFNHQDRFIITSHYGLEYLIITLIRFQNNPTHIQRFINKLLRNFPFAQYYINNIVIFSDTGPKYIQHLKKIFHTL